MATKDSDTHGWPKKQYINRSFEDDVPGWPFGAEKRRVLDVFNTHYGTKLFVENGVLVEEKIQSHSHGDSAGTAGPVGFLPGLCYEPPKWPVEEHVLDQSQTINSAKRTYYNTRDADSAGIDTDTAGTAFPVGFLPGLCYNKKPNWPANRYVEDQSQTINSAKSALEYYNTRQDTHYVLVNPINSNAFIRSGKIWIHSSFTAKADTSTETCQAGPGKAELFFAEVMIAGHEGGSAKYVTTACRVLDDSKAIDHCEICPKGSFSHPKSKFRQGCYKVISRALRPRSNGKVVKKRAPNSWGY